MELYFSSELTCMGSEPCRQRPPKALAGEQHSGAVTQHCCVLCRLGLIQFIRYRHYVLVGHQIPGMLAAFVPPGLFLLLLL